MRPPTRRCVRCGQDKPMEAYGVRRRDYGKDDLEYDMASPCCISCKENRVEAFSNLFPLSGYVGR